MMTGCHPGRWWWGLPVLAVLWAGTAWLVTPHVEADRARREMRAAAPLPAFSVARIGQRIVLRGRIAPESRKAIETILRASGFGGEIADETAAENVGVLAALDDNLRAAIRALVRLADGEAKLGPDGLSLVGRAVDFDAYNTLRDGMRGVASLDLTPPEASPFVWSAERRGDTLDLSGFVPSESARAALLGDAAGTLQGLRVSDRMQTAGGVPRGLVFMEAARFALAQLARLGEGRVALSGATLALDGAAQERDALAAVAEAMRGALPAGIVAGPVTLAALPVSPYRFGAQRGRGFLTLTGYAPDAETRRRILDVARKAFLTEQIADQLHIGDGAPSGFLAGASFGLEQLGRLASGEARISGAALTISGEALYRQSGEQTRSRILTGAPPGWTSSAEIAINTRERVLDAEFCQDLLSEARQREPIQFEAKKATLTGEAQQRVATVASLLKRCGPSSILLGIDPEPEEGPAGPLARTRAETVVAALVRAGIGSDRLRIAPAPAIATAPAIAPPGDKAATAAMTFTVER